MHFVRFSQYGRTTYVAPRKQLTRQFYHMVIVCDLSSNVDTLTIPLPVTFQQSEEVKRLVYHDISLESKPLHLIYIDNHSQLRLQIPVRT